MRCSLPLLMLMPAIAAIAADSATPGAPTGPRPAVVELFTSEGCSSCPPAEAYLGELARRPDVLALAFHVDYWDGLGWRDRYGIDAATPRQRAYAQALRLRSVYTPQVVLDGTADFVGSDRARIAHALETSRHGLTVGVTVHDGQALIDVPAQAGAAASDVLLVTYRRSAESAIGRGENSGLKLTEYNIVRSLRVLGRYAGEAAAYQVELADLPQDATDLAVLVQSASHGPVLAAASRPLR